MTDLRLLWLTARGRMRIIFPAPLGLQQLGWGSNTLISCRFLKSLLPSVCYITRTIHTGILRGAAWLRPSFLSGLGEKASRASPNLRCLFSQTFAALLILPI